METAFSQEDKLHTGLEVERSVRDSMQSLVQWSNINAVIGFVSLALSLINLVITYNNMSAFNSPASTMLLVTGIVSFVLNLIINLSLFNFGRQLKLALADEDQEAFNKAAAHLKAYFRLLVVMIIVVVIMAVMSGIR